MTTHLILHQVRTTQINTSRITVSRPIRARLLSTTSSRSRASELQTNDTNVYLEEQSIQERELEIEKLRNKSRLRPDDRKVLFDQRPFADSENAYHFREKFLRNMFGKYGNESGVNPAMLWPNKNDIQERKEYEKVAHPYSIQELVKFAQNEIKERDLLDKEQHDKVVANMAKLDTWKKEIKERIAKKEAEALAAREKKEKLIDEVRRHFGFTVDPKDEKFKEMLAVKEKEQRKKEKLAKQDEKERKAISKLMAKHDISNPETEDNAKISSVEKQ